jgi:hypothetical protein
MKTIIPFIIPLIAAFLLGFLLYYTPASLLLDLSLLMALILTTIIYSFFSDWNEDVKAVRTRLWFYKVLLTHPGIRSLYLRFEWAKFRYKIWRLFHHGS